MGVLPSSDASGGGVEEGEKGRDHCVRHVAVCCARACTAAAPRMARRDAGRARAAGGDLAGAGAGAGQAASSCGARRPRAKKAQLDHLSSAPRRRRAAVCRATRCAHRCARRSGQRGERWCCSVRVPRSPPASQRVPDEEDALLADAATPSPGPAAGQRCLRPRMTPPSALPTPPPPTVACRTLRLYAQRTRDYLESLCTPRGCGRGHAEVVGCLGCEDQADDLTATPAAASACLPLYGTS